MYALIAVTKPPTSSVKNLPGHHPESWNAQGRPKAERLNACKLDLEGRDMREFSLSISYFGRFRLKLNPVGAKELQVTIGTLAIKLYS